MVLNKKKIEKTMKMNAVLRSSDLRANRLYLIFNLLASIGYKIDVHIITKDSVVENFNKNNSDFLINIHRMDGIFSIPKLGNRLFKFFAPFWALRNIIKKNEYLFICQEYHLPFALWAKIFFNNYIYYDQREMFLFGVSRNLTKFQKYLLSIRERLLLKYVDIVTTVDSHKGIWLHRYKKLHNNVHIVKNVPSLQGIDLEHIKNNIKKRKLGGVIHLAIVGAIKNNKGIDHVIEAIKIVPNEVHLHLMGVISQQYIKKIKEKISTDKSGCKIFTKQWMPYNDLVKFISKFHIGLLTKQPNIGQYGWIGRGNSRKPFTYMHAGLPVIAPSHKSVALQVEENKCGLRIDIEKSSAIAKAIVQIISTTENYRRMSINGLEAIKNEFNWEKESQHLKKNIIKSSKVSLVL